MKLKTKVFLCVLFFLMFHVLSSVFQINDRGPVVALPSTGELNEELYEAVLHEEFENIDRLLKAGVDVNIRFEDGYTPLVVAAVVGHLEIALFLIEKGANVNVRNLESGKSLLEMAAWEGNMKMASVLLDNGANVNSRNKVGLTPLMTAALNGHTKMVVKLLEKDANVNARDINDFTPLMLAVLENHIDTVLVLLDKGAMVNVEAIDGATPLTLARGLGYEKMVHLLLERGAQPKRRKPGTGEVVQT